MFGIRNPSPIQETHISKSTMSLPIPAVGSKSPKLDPATQKAIDAPLVALAEKCNGDLRQLLFAVFSFLNRRTDFYMVPHNDDLEERLPHKMGFKEGDAEKLLLAAFRQFPLRRMPRQGKGDAAAKTSSQNTTTPRKDPPGERKDAVTKQSSAKPKSSGDDPKEEEIRFTDEGKQVPVGNGGITPKYRWTQTLEETTVLLAIPSGTRGKDLSVVLKPSSISVKMKKALAGEAEPRTLLEGPLSSKIQRDESTWSLEGGALLLVLQKVKNTWWENVLEGDDKIDTSLVDSRRHISSYDESTQAALRKIVFDQRQQQLGLPTSDQILKKEGKHLIPPMPPGVEYIDKEKLDGAASGRAEA